jgi:hypothetical protein
MTDPLPLYDALIAAGVPVDNHESDLYFLATDEAHAILARYPIERGNARRFVSETDGAVWIEVPFSYLPWWRARASRRPDDETAHYRCEG